MTPLASILTMQRYIDQKKQLVKHIYENIFHKFDGNLFYNLTIYLLDVMIKEENKLYATVASSCSFWNKWQIMHDQKWSTKCYKS